MLRFLGNIEAKTDAKGRVFLPAVFRKMLLAEGEERLVMRKDVHQECLVLYPESVWWRMQGELRARLNRWNSRQQMLFRQFVSDVEVLTPDTAGRILLSRRYRELAGITTDVRFIGMDDTIEIWATSRTGEPFVGAEEFSRAMEMFLDEETDRG